MTAAPRSNDVEEKKRQFPSLHTVGLVAQPPPREPPKPLLRTLEVRMIEVNRLSDINIIGQRFRAEVVVQLAFVDGNLDDHLKNPSDVPAGRLWPTHIPPIRCMVHGSSRLQQRTRVQDLG